MSKRDRDRRQQRLRDRQKRSQDERGQRGGSGRKYLNLNKANGDIEWFKPGKRNLISVVPFEVTNEEYQNMRGPGGNRIGVRVGDLEYKLELPIHPRQGPEQVGFICPEAALGLPCFPCEQRKGLEWPQDKAEMQPLNISWRDLYNLKDQNADDDELIHLWEVSYKLFEEEMLDELEEEELEQREKDPDFSIDIGNLKESCDIKFRGAEKTIPDSKGRPITFYEFKSFDFPERDDLDEKVLKEVHPLDQMYLVPTYEQTKAWFLGIEPEDEEPEAETEKPSRSDKDDVPPGEPEDKTEKGSWDGLDDMDKKEMLEFMEDQDIRIRGAKRMKEKQLRKALEDEKPEPEEKTMTRGAKGGKDKKKDKDEKNPCPEGLEFGTDCDDKPECDDCNPDVWKECAKEQDKLAKE